jgi:uncharacterized protein (DUF58 family)
MFSLAKSRKDQTPSRRAQAEKLAARFPALMVEAERVALTVAQGIHGRRRSGQGETFWQYRHWHEEDTRAAIDWRKSAKSDHYFVREREWEAAQSVWLWVEPDASMQFRSDHAAITKRERAEVLALALASLLIRGGERVGLLGHPHPPSTGRAALNRIAYALLSGENAVRMLRLEEAILPRHARLVAIGDFLRPSRFFEAAVKAQGGRGVVGVALQVADPAEEDLPYTGRTLFESMTGGDGIGSLLIGRVDGVRGDYVARYRAHREALRDIARRAGWRFTAHRTDRPPHGALLALYAALADMPLPARQADEHALLKR